MGEHRTSEKRVAPFRPDTSPERLRELHLLLVENHTLTDGDIEDLKQAIYELEGAKQEGWVP